jgi:TolB protein
MFRHARRMIAAASITVAIVATTAGPALATLPGHNGQITFQRFDAAGHWQIWVANPDLTHQRQITDGDFDSGFPAWSPDTTRIAFESNRSDPDLADGREVVDVFTMRVDGTDVRKITDSLGYNGKPSYSPDGRWILFDSDRADYPRSQGIYIIRADGSAAPRRLTTLSRTDGWQELARFSPDGSRIVFDEVHGEHVLRNHRDGAVVSGHDALFTIRPDGSDLRQITPWGIHGGDADWSPDGKKLVFAGQPTHIGNIGDVQVVDADGKHLAALTNDHGLTGIGQESSVWYEESFNAVWSPDGTKILFAHWSFNADQGFVAGLQTINPDGSGRAWVSDTRAEEHQPEWGTLPLAP